METAAINDAFRGQMAARSTFADDQLRHAALQFAVEAHKSGASPEKTINEKALEFYAFLKTGQF